MNESTAMSDTVCRRPGHDAAATVHRRVGHVHAVHLAQFRPGTLAGFGNALWHPVQVLQGGLAGKQRGGIGDRAERSLGVTHRSDDVMRKNVGALTFT